MDMQYSHRALYGQSPTTSPFNTMSHKPQTPQTVFGAEPNNPIKSPLGNSESNRWKCTHGRSSTTSSPSTMNRRPQTPQTTFGAEHSTPIRDPFQRSDNSDDYTTERRETRDDHSDEDVRSAELASLHEIVCWQRGEMEAMKRAIEDMQGLLARQRREERDLSWQLREHRAVSHGRATLVRDWREHARGIRVAYRSTIRRQAAEISLLKAEVAQGRRQDQALRRESAPPREYGGGYGGHDDV
ncbi:hypothetical protein MCOR02_004845 [Pyricularia oryzae]|uniref:Uncharacterized protein n=1 Tax=Pyricularia oryzae TaxID=318829 RepID=A0A4P7N1N5_PYROR|nr:hypothetical protein MCOR02_004845 [Pyricularia oryzae]KAI6311984.1 hypothetical protein MCOR34_005795 [Pyricularia oryzae]KAI6476163.1 hypothetical protein MCOR17_001196 [Pyricularia oryzae]KAI6479630.1 hypothetical protein MCOR13_011389 [Pyricularia oryzae]KAI6578263.1 hypothetical protein MCOR04_006479 [Pyricularia oryzae]